MSFSLYVITDYQNMILDIGKEIRTLLEYGVLSPQSIG